MFPRVYNLLELIIVEKLCVEFGGKNYDEYGGEFNWMLKIIIRTKGNFDFNLFHI